MYQVSKTQGEAPRPNESQLTLNREVRITIYAEISGHIWMPQVRCEKHIKAVFTTDHSKPFMQEWSGMRNALLSITNDGDFRSCGIDDAFCTVEIIEDFRLFKSRRDGGRFITRTRALSWTIQPTAALADLFNVEGDESNV